MAIMVLKGGKGVLYYTVTTRGLSLVMSKVLKDEKSIQIDLNGCNEFGRREICTRSNVTYTIDLISGHLGQYSDT